MVKAFWYCDICKRIIIPQSYNCQYDGSLKNFECFKGKCYCKSCSKELDEECEATMKRIRKKIREAKK